MVNDSDQNLETIFGSLTSKQRQTIELLADGRTSKEIASELQISESAAVQRIETLRAKAGGMLRKDLARLYRDYQEPGQEPGQVRSDLTCKEDTGNKIHLPAWSIGSNNNPGNYAEPVLTLGDAITFERSAPWSGPSEPRVVPEVLDGENFALNRWLAAVILAIGMVILMLVLLAVAGELGQLV